jgi:ubiquinone/menaquinone biosynthesis C-methylase UbiE
MTTLENYPLGYSEAESKRLAQQGAMLEGMTEDLLRRAGLSRGMRVLDVGCGAGDVSLLAARIVGPSGRVLGIDRAASILEIAKYRAELSGARNVSFIEADVAAYEPAETFGAIVGRLVLLYLADPANTLRKLSRNLDPGGVIAFNEYDMSAVAQTPESPLFANYKKWQFAGFQSVGVELDMGSKLYATFLQAGLPCPQMISAQPVHCGPEAIGYDYGVQLLRSLLPTVERNGIATAAEVDIETLAERLRDDAVSRRAVLFTPRLVGAWAKVPSLK